MMRNLTILTAALAMTLAGAAEARGLLLASEQLPENTRAILKQQIAQARATSPEAFAQLKAFASRAEELEARKRGRMAPMGPTLSRMGPSALWPMVELLAFDANDVSAEIVSDAARQSLTVGLLQAVGQQQETSLEPLFTAVLRSRESRVLVLRAAADALGHLQTDSAAKILVALSEGDGVHREAVLWGMGSCRRTVVASALADALHTNASPELMKKIVQSLGDVGNAWAWRTPAVTAKEEEGPVRRIAAEALVSAYLEFDGEVRQAASNALLVVDAPGTEALIAAAREGRSEADLALLDKLAERFRRNPTRIR